MKILLSTLALLFVCGAANAQYYKRCYEPDDPFLPSGHYEEKWQMESAQSDVEEFFEQLFEYQECLKRNFQEASDHADQVNSDWSDAVNAYNSRF